MGLNKKFNQFGSGKSWTDKVLEADDIWAQVKAILDKNGKELPKTPRRPDVRMIIENTTGRTVKFKNPGDHSGSKKENIPGDGDKKAVMVMVKGDDLNEQYQNAQKLYDKYDLGTTGLSDAFVSDLEKGLLSDYVDEAYGPAPYGDQTAKLVDVDWEKQDQTIDTIIPVKGENASFGARAATDETVFLAQFHIYVKGTGTVPELVESNGINIAVSSDWQTGAESTRPIVPSVAKTYYGSHVTEIPTVIVHPDGQVKEVIFNKPSLVSKSLKSKKKPLKR